MATDSTIEGRMTSILEHQSPDVRCIAVRCLSGAWLRIWSLLDQGQLRQQLFDEENENEGLVRQHTGDRTVFVWKIVLTLCMKASHGLKKPYQSLEVLCIMRSSMAHLREFEFSCCQLSF